MVSRQIRLGPSIVNATLSEPAISVGVLGRLGLLLLIVFGFAMAAQLLVGAPY